jgi:hypothetical protein
MPNQWNGKDNRWGERVAVNIPVRVSAPAVSDVDGCMTDLSLSGALLRAPCDLPLHALIEVCITLPAPTLGAAVLVAHVARKIAADVGVEWCEFAPSAVKALLAVTAPPAVGHSPATQGP